MSIIISLDNVSQTLFPSLSDDKHEENNRMFALVWNGLKDHGVCCSPTNSYPCLIKVEQGFMIIDNNNLH